MAGAPKILLADDDAAFLELYQEMLEEAAKYHAWNPQRICIKVPFSEVGLRVLHQLVQKGVFGYVADLPQFPYDADRARALLAEAGYPHGFTTELVHRSGTSMETVAGLLRGMLARIGVTLNTRSQAWAEVVSGWQPYTDDGGFVLTLGLTVATAHK